MIFIKTISDVFAHAWYKYPVNSCFHVLFARSRAPYSGYVQIADVPYSLEILYGAGHRIKAMLRLSHKRNGRYTKTCDNLGTEAK